MPDITAAYDTDDMFADIANVIPNAFQGLADQSQIYRMTDVTRVLQNRSRWASQARRKFLIQLVVPTNYRHGALDGLDWPVLPGLGVRRMVFLADSIHRCLQGGVKELDDHHAEQTANQQRTLDSRATQPGTTGASTRNITSSCRNAASMRNAARNPANE